MATREEQLDATVGENDMPDSGCTQLTQNLKVDPSDISLTQDTTDCIGDRVYPTTDGSTALVESSDLESNVSASPFLLSGLGR